MVFIGSIDTVKGHQYHGARTIVHRRCQGWDVRPEVGCRCAAASSQHRSSAQLSTATSAGLPRHERQEQLQGQELTYLTDGACDRVVLTRRALIALSFDRHLHHADGARFSTDQP